MFFHEDKVRVHTCVVPLVKCIELGYELLPLLPYSPPDLAPRGWFQIRKNGWEEMDLTPIIA